MGCAPVWVKIYIFETRARVREAFNSNTVDSKMNTSYFKFTIPHSRLATIQHLANSEKKDELAGANPPQKITSDVYAVTAGVKGGKLSPFEKFGNFDVLKCPLLASEDGFSSYYIQFFVRKF